ncbi:8823_t:CDS:2, partial [Cetraspora pellucida]
VQLCCNLGRELVGIGSSVRSSRSNIVGGIGRSLLTAGDPDLLCEDYERISIRVVVGTVNPVGISFCVKLTVWAN